MYVCKPFTSRTHNVCIKTAAYMHNMHSLIRYSVYVYTFVLYIQVQAELNEDLEALTEWLKNNKLKLNSTKSVAILITTSQIKKQQIINKHPNVKIRLDGYVLDLCDKVKYLGIIIYSLLKLHEHIIYTANKIAKKVGYLARIGR
jgi:hypothetical protein